MYLFILVLSLSKKLCVYVCVCLWRPHWTFKKDPLTFVSAASLLGAIESKSIHVPDVSALNNFSWLSSLPCTSRVALL